METYYFGTFSTRTLLKELSYQRQFAGIKGVNYHREYCQCIAKELRVRGV